MKRVLNSLNRSMAFLCISIFALIGSCAASTLVVPSGLDVREGTGASGILNQSGREQTVYRSGNFPSGAVPSGSSIVIQELHFRPNVTDYMPGAPFTNTISHLRITLSTTVINPGGLSANFANNVGADATTVFDGSATLSSHASGPAAGPKAFDIVITLAHPFHYRPSAGNLLVDIQNFSGETTGPIDANSSAFPSPASRIVSSSAVSSMGTTDGEADVVQFVYSIAAVTNPPPPPPPPTNACVTPPAGLVAWWRGESNAVDIVGGNNGTLIGGTNFAAGAVGAAFQFNGVNQLVEVPASPAVDPASALSLEAWVNLSGYSANDSSVIAGSDCSYCIEQYALVMSQVSGLWYFRAELGNGSTYTFVTSSTPVQTNAWYHIAMTYDGATLRLYVNGALAGTVAAVNAMTATTQGFVIGGLASGPWDFYGQVDEVSLYNRALTGSEVLGVYTAGAGGKCLTIQTNSPPPPTNNCVAPPAGLVAWWQGESNTLDSAGTNNGTWVGGTNYASGEVGTAFQFNGLNQVVVIPASPAVDPTNSLSMETWVNLSGYSGNDSTVIAGSDCSFCIQQYALSMSQVSGHWVFRAQLGNGGGYVLATGTTAAQTNTWYHVAMTYDGTTLKLYVNGALDASAAAVNAMTPTTQGFSIGGLPSGPWDFAGRIDELSLYNRALTSSEVLGIYTAGAGGKCTSGSTNLQVLPPPFPFSATNGLVVPHGLDTKEGAGSSSVLNQIVREQTVYGATNFPPGAISIQQLRLRPNVYDYIAGVPFSNIISHMRIALSTTTRAPDGLSGNFAANSGADATVVLDGSVILSSGDTGPANGPKTFDIIIPLTHPFTYNPALGNLLVDIQNFSGEPTTTIDAENSGSDSSSRVSGGVNNASGNPDTGADVLQIVYSPTTNAPPPPPPQTNNCVTPPAGLVAWWQGESNTLDSAGTNNGTWVGGTNYATGEVGTAFQFNGLNQVVEIPASPVVDPTNSLTLETWVNLSGYSGNDSTVIAGSDCSFCIQQYALSMSQVSGHWVFRAQLGNGGGYVLATGSTAAQTNTWYHVAMTYDGTTLKLYVNGVSDASAAAVNAMTPTTQSFSIGGLPSGPWDFAGRIDELSLYNRALTSSEVLGIYTAGAGGKCSLGATNLQVLPPPFPSSATNGLVVPHGLDTKEGAGASSVLNQVVREQTVYGASNFPVGTISIQQLRLRPNVYDYIAGVPFSNTISHLRIVLSTTTQSPDGLSGNFGNNIGADATVVLDGPITLSSGDTGPANGPKTFDIIIPLAHPFTYNPAQGNLLMDVQNFSGEATTTIDAENSGSDFSSRVSGGVNNASGNTDTAADVLQIVYSPTTNAPPPATNACVTPPSGLVAWWQGESNTLDSLGTNNGTAVGNLSYAPGEVGHALTLNGSNAYVAVPSTNNLKFTGPFTVEGWINFASISGGGAGDMILSKTLDADTSGDYALAVSQNSKLRPHANIGGLWYNFDCTTTLTSNHWYHVAMVYDGTALRGYVNGALDGSASASGAVGTSDNPLRLGVYSPSANLGFFPGLLDEISLYNRALSASEIQSVYAAGTYGKCGSTPTNNPPPPPPPTNNCVTPPAGLVAWWQGESNTLDSLGTNNGTWVGGTNYATGEVGTTFQFNGLNQVVEIPASPAVDPTNSLSLETWVNLSGYSGNDSTVIAGSDCPFCIQQYALTMTQVSGQWFFRAQLGNGGGYALVTSTNAVQTNTWYHVAMTYNGAMLFLYVNGAVEASVAASNAMTPTTQAFAIGGLPSGPWDFAGRIDELSLYNRALTSSEVLGIYTAGAGGKCSSGNTNQTSNFVLPGSGVPSPTLRVAASPSNITLSWPASAANFSLKGSPDLLNWVPVNATPVTNGADLSIDLPSSNGVRFFRLQGN
jgi:hypothetical protein